MQSEVDIIIPSLNSPIIDRVVGALLEQTEARAIGAIFIVGRDDPGLVPQADKTRFIDTGKPVSAGIARNLGIEASSAPLLLFIDSDCIPARDWVAAHLAAHDGPHEVVGGGVQPTGSDYWHCAYNLSLFNKTLTTAPAGSREILPTLNLSVRRSVIDRVGMMKAELLRAQDAEWIQRMRNHGITPYFVPDAAVCHEHNRHDLRAAWRDFARSGYFSRLVRLEHKDLLKTPLLLESRVLTRLLGPLVGIWSLAEIARSHPGFVSRYWKYLPAIYLTKLAWCWGAGQREAPAHLSG